MKLTLYTFLTLAITISLNANNEFPLIKPYAVEDAPTLSKDTSVVVTQKKEIDKKSLLKKIPLKKILLKKR